jgi:hypothetical protein
MASLFAHIFHVVVICSDPKMFWVYARRVVTFVQDKQFIRDRPDVEFIRNSVCVEKLPS